MSNKISILALIVALIALGGVFLRPVQQAGSETKKETAFERVMRTRTLRCAYLSRAHHYMRGADNKKVTGIDYEIVEAIGKALHLKVEWAEEVGYGIFPEQLNSGKEDAFCTTVWASSTRAQRAVSTAPVFYTPLYAYVRKEDHRFDLQPGNINSGETSIAVIDGTPSIFVAETAFPQAKKYALPGDSGDSDRVLAVATKKADVVIVDEATAGSYNQQNKNNEIRRILPVRTFPETFYVAMNEWALRELLNAAIADLQNNGTIDRILNKYESDFGSILRVTKSHETMGK